MGVEFVLVATFKISLDEIFQPMRNSALDGSFPNHLNGQRHHRRDSLANGTVVVPGKTMSLTDVEEKSDHIQALYEECKRDPKNYLELSRILCNIYENSGLLPQTLAESLGLHPARFRTILKINDCSPVVLEMLGKGTMSLTTASTFADLSHSDQKKALKHLQKIGATFIKLQPKSKEYLKGFLLKKNSEIPRSRKGKAAKVEGVKVVMVSPEPPSKMSPVEEVRATVVRLRSALLELDFLGVDPLSFSYSAADRDFILQALKWHKEDVVALRRIIEASRPLHSVSVRLNGSNGKHLNSS